MLFLPLIFFIFYTISFVTVTKRSFGQCLIPAMLGSILPYYISQMIWGTFAIGFWINVICCLVPLVVIGIKWKDKKYLYLIYKNICSGGLVAFVLIYFAFTIFDLNRAVLGWDSFSHWAIMVKEMWRLDSFYSVAESLATTHKDYPPAMQFFKYEWLKLAREYNDHLLVRSLHILQFSMLIPFVEKRAEKLDSTRQVLRTILLTVTSVGALYTIMLFMDHHQVINTIYTDYIMAVLLAYLLSFVLTEEEWSAFMVVVLTVGGIYLLTIKQMGLPLWLIIIFAYFAKYIGEKKYKGKHSIGFFVGTVIILIIPLVVYETWQIYIKRLNISGDFNPSQIRISELLSGENEIAHLFMEAIWRRTLTSSHIMPVSYMLSVIVGLLIIAVMGWTARKKGHAAKYGIAILGLTIGAVGYAFVMMSLFAFCFDKQEAMYLASFDRYMSTFVIAMLAVAVMLAMTDAKRDRTVNIAYAAVIVTVLLLSDNRLYVLPAVKPGASYYEQLAEEQEPSEDGVIYISSDDENEFNALKYYLSPVEVRETGE